MTKYPNRFKRLSDGATMKISNSFEDAWARDNGFIPEEEWSIIEARIVSEKSIVSETMEISSPRRGRPPLKFGSKV